MTSPQVGHRLALREHSLPYTAVQRADVNERTAGDHISVGFAA